MIDYHTAPLAEFRGPTPVWQPARPSQLLRVTRDFFLHGICWGVVLGFALALAAVLKGAN